MTRGHRDTWKTQGAHRDLKCWHGVQKLEKEESVFQRGWPEVPSEWKDDSLTAPVTIPEINLR